MLQFVHKFVQCRAMSESLLHVCDVVLASAYIISNVSKLSHFVSQEAVEGSPRLKQTSVLTTLANISAHLFSICGERLIVWSELQ